MHPGRFIPSRLLLLLVLLTSAATAATDDQPVVIKEPQYGEVLYYFYQEDYFPAIVRLLAAREQGQLAEHAADAELLLGGMYLSYGHHIEAAEIFERLLADKVEDGTRNRTWFFLAKIWYQRGYLDRAQQALANISGDLPDVLEREALMVTNSVGEKEQRR